MPRTKSSNVEKGKQGVVKKVELICCPQVSTCVLWIFFLLPDILRDCHQFSVALPLHFAYR